MRANRSHCLAFPVCPLSSNYENRFHLSSWNLESYFVRWLKFKLKISKEFSNLLPFHDDCIFSNGSCSCSLFSIGSAVCTKRQKFQIYNICCPLKFYRNGNYLLMELLQLTRRWAKSYYKSVVATFTDTYNCQYYHQLLKIYDMLNLWLKMQFLLFCSIKLLMRF